MTETTETTETAVAPLAKSITHVLTDLAAHACVHGHHDAKADRPIPEDMPPCLVDHVGSLTATLFDLTRPEEHGCTITTSVELPAEEVLPEGLVEKLQDVTRDLAAHLGLGR